MWWWCGFGVALAWVLHSLVKHVIWYCKKIFGFWWIVLFSYFNAFFIFNNTHGNKICWIIINICNIEQSYCNMLFLFNNIDLYFFIFLYQDCCFIENKITCMNLFVVKKNDTHLNCIYSNLILNHKLMNFVMNNDF